MDPAIDICDEHGIQLFLGKCVETDSWRVCPSEPVVVEHLGHEDEHLETALSHGEHTPHDCHRNKHGALMCPSDLYRAFDHGSCFRVHHKFICEEDMTHIEDDKCIDAHPYKICGLDMHRLFHGEEVAMHDGHLLKADFATPIYDRHSALCRTHDGIEFCLENILDLYQPPHDCVMFAGEWLCQEEMVHAWKEGCVDVDHHTACGKDMVDVVLQSCIDINENWVCPTAVGTQHNN